jgi:hypothetical protein
MIHTQLSYLIAQQNVDELHRAAERRRFARRIRADRPVSSGLARLRPAFVARRSLVISDPA